jgi:hypothetical protein
MEVVAGTGPTATLLVIVIERETAVAVSSMAGGIARGPRLVAVSPSIPGLAAASIARSSAHRQPWLRLASKTKVTSR